MAIFGRKGSPEKPEKDPEKIRTSGDFSPGIVKGDFIVNQTIVRQEKTTKRKTWRPLDSITLPLMSDTSASRLGVWKTMAETLVEMFGQISYTDFNILVNSDSAEKNGQVVPVRQMVTYQPGFCPQVQRKYALLIKQIMAWKDAGATTEGRISLESKLKQDQACLEGWTQIVDVPTSPAWTPVQCVCDSAGKKVSFQAIEKYSVNPADYPEHIGNSKEFLLLISSYFNAEGLAFGGDIGWATNNYSLMKFTMAVLDRTVDLDKVRVNVDDPYEWDYINGDLDAEIRTFARKNPDRE